MDGFATSAGHLARPRSRRTRAAVRAAVVTTLTCGFVVAGIAPVHAIEPSPSSGPTMRAAPGAAFAAPAAAAPSGLTDAVSRDLGLSMDEYLAQAAAARTATDVVASLGDVVRTAWLSGTELHVAVRSTRDVPRATAAGARAHAGDPLTDALDAARRHDELTYIDRGAGRVVIVEEDATGGPVVQVKSAMTDDDTEADQPWLGGLGFAVEDDVSHTRCSTAFAGVGADGEPRLLTSGHCGVVAAGDNADAGDDADVRRLDLATPAWEEGELADTWTTLLSAPLGSVAAGTFRFGDGDDAGLIDVDEDTGARAEVAGWSDDGSGLPVYDAIEPIAGAPVCKAGASSGWTCGRILDVDTTVDVDDATVSGVLLDACTLDGDSGGAVMVGPYALGVSSASTWSGPVCDGQVGPGGVAVAFPLASGPHNVEAVYGSAWDLSISVGTPAVEAPAAGAVVSPTPTFSGTVEAAAGAEVTVFVDDEPHAAATAGADGRWSVRLTEPLLSGSHSYAVAASHTPATASAATTSERAEGTFEVADVAQLRVSAPADGEATSARPTFDGTGHRGATVSLTVGGAEAGSVVVDDQGAWALRPANPLPPGVIDAVLTQTTGASSDAVTVTGLAVAPPAPVVASPAKGERVAADHTFTGTAAVGATVTLTVQARPAGSGDGAGAALPKPLSLQSSADAEGAWEIRLPAPMPAGAHSVSAVQTVDALVSPASSPIAFRVGDVPDDDAGAVGGGSEDDDLAETGSSPLLLLVGAALVLTAFAAVTWAIRARRPAAHLGR